MNMDKKEKSTYRKIENRSFEGFFLIVRGLEVGVISGLVSVLYRFLLSKAELYMDRLSKLAGASVWSFIAIFFAAGLTGFFVSKLVKWEPMSSGSGIPQVSGEIKGYFSQNWFKVITAKLVGGSLSVLCGLSLGREGPSIQLGAMAGKGISRITNADKTTQLRLMSCGGGAGLAAAFNAPIAGVMFVLEEIHKTIDRSIIFMGIVACVTADFVSKLFFGQSNIFAYETRNIPLRYYWLLIILGAVLGLCGCGYNIVMSKIQDLFRKTGKCPDWIKFVAVFILGAAAAIFIPVITGGGHRMVDFLFNENPQLWVILLLLALKFIFSAISFGSGAPGGIFFPLLILGTYIGTAFAKVFIPVLNLDEGLWQEFAVISMAGLFASIVRAPLTGIILVFEMTGSLESLLPLAVVSIISFALSDFLGVKPIYDILLEKLVDSGCSRPEFKDTDEKVVKTYIVPVGSKISGLNISEVDWGKHCLVVGIRKNGVCVTPKGSTNISEGDEINILVSQRRYSKDSKRLEKIINGK